MTGSELFEGGQAAMEENLRNVTERLRSSGGFLEQINMRFLSCDCGEKTLTLYLEPKPWMANPMGVMHGGVAAGLLDTAMGTLSSLAAGVEGRTPTVDMHVSYLRPVPLDKRLCVRSQLVAAGRTLNRLTAEIWADGEGERLLATATGTFFVGRR